MKRFLIFTLMISVASSMLAAAGYSSDSSDWEALIPIITFAAAVLQIILFFKIWGMTNDIKALKKDHFCETEFNGEVEMAKYLRKNLVLGNMDTVKRILLQNFIDNVENAFNNSPFIVGKGEKSIIPYVNCLIKQYAKIGEEVPTYIIRMKTFNDYFNLFVASDLKVQDEKDTKE